MDWPDHIEWRDRPMPGRYRARPTPHRNGVIRADLPAGTRVVRFRMRSDRRAVKRAVERVLVAVKDVGLRTARCHDLAVAVAEALSNAAVHGNGLSPRASVGVSVEVTPRERAVVEVRDSGPGF